MPAMGPGAGCLWGFLPVVIEGDQLPLQERRAGCDQRVQGAWLLPALQRPPTRSRSCVGMAVLRALLLFSGASREGSGLVPQPRGAGLVDI